MKQLFTGLPTVLKLVDKETLMREREEKKKVSEVVLCPCIQKFTDKPKMTFLSEESVHQVFSSSDGGREETEEGRGRQEEAGTRGLSGVSVSSVPLTLDSHSLILFHGFRWPSSPR